MEKENETNKRIWFGLFLIIIGIIWILLKLNLIPNFWTDILVSWQMLIIGIGIFSIIGGNNTAGTILIVIGGFFLMPEMFHIPFYMRRVAWPILIIAIGLSLIITHRRRTEISVADPGKSETDRFDDFVIFGGREILVNSKNFLGGRITAMFGGAEYDLRQVDLSDDGAVIDCVAIFGGCGFKVPPDWTVINEVNTVFGAFSDKRGMSVNIITDPSKKLIVKGFSAFGGVEVKYQ